MQTFSTGGPSLVHALPSTIGKCSILDLLTFASFLVSNMPYTAQTYGVRVNSGLNFACLLRLNGLLWAIEHTLGIPEPLTLTGPIIMSSPSATIDSLVPLPWPPNNMTAPLPGINLKAWVAVDFSIEQMALDELFPIDIGDLTHPGVRETDMRDDGTFLRLHKLTLIETMRFT